MRGMEITRAKLLSLTIAALYVFVTFIAMGATPALGCFVGVLLPLTLIWFPDELGSYTGGAGRGQSIDMESPDWAVAGLGWFFLIGGPVILVYIASK